MSLAPGQSTGYASAASVSLCDWGQQQILATSLDPETHSHPSLCLATVVLHAGKSLHLMGRTSREVTRSDTFFFAENPRALLLSCYFCQMLWAPNGDSGKNTVSQCFPILLSHQVDFLPSHIGALCTASQPYPQGQSALVVFNFKAFHSQLWGRHSHKT